MQMKKLLIGARQLNFDTKEGDHIEGTQLFTVDFDIKNLDDGRIPEKIFISDLGVYDNLSKVLAKADRDVLIPIELSCSINGNKVKYHSAKPI